MMTIDAWWEREKSRIVGTLAEYIRIDTTTPDEMAAYPFLQRYLEPLDFDMVAYRPPEALWRHPERCPEPASRLTPESRLLRAVRHGRGGGRKLVVNAHVDVVPAGSSFRAGFAPDVREDRITGRGAVDTKGNLVMFAEAIRYLRDQGRAPRHDIIIDLVAEEEIGGSGALASALTGIDADCALVLEPTNLNVFRGHRGCVTFEAEFSGSGTHMGQDAGPPASAIDIASAAIHALKEHEARLNAVKDRCSSFRHWDRAVQVNVGIIQGGEWWGSVAARCRILGNCGFLPDQGLAGAKESLRATLSRVMEAFPGACMELRWPGLHNEAYVTAEDDGFCQAVLQAAGLESCGSWNVSCDGRHYARILGLPTMIFGCGRLEDAHSDHETLRFDEFKRGLAIIAALLDGPLTRGTTP